MQTSDTYNTIESKCVGEVFKNKKSKFIGISVPVNQEDLIPIQLEIIKKEFKNANHYCYAYKIGIENYKYRTNDDGEPRHSAGNPILGQIESYKLTNVLIVVVRYYGGVKLGVGGLINAYKNTTKLVLNTSNIITKRIDYNYEVEFGYEYMDIVMRLLGQLQANNIKINQSTSCKVQFSVRKKYESRVEDIFKEFYEINLEKL